jgi:hypothetical protein
MTTKLISLAIAVIVFCIFAYTALAAPVVSVDPASIEVSHGDRFTVNIVVDPHSVAVMGAGYRLYFDNSLLNAVGQSNGTFLSHDGATTMEIANRFNNTAGVVEYGETRIDTEVEVNASGILATITFNAIESGACDLTLSKVVLSETIPKDPFIQSIPDVGIHNGRCIIRGADVGAPATCGTHTATSTTTTTSSTQTVTTPATTVTTNQSDIDAPTPPLPKPRITTTVSTTPALIHTHPSEESTATPGFTSAFAVIGMLMGFYIIAKRKR